MKRHRVTITKKVKRLDPSGGCCGLDILHYIWDNDPAETIRYVASLYLEGMNWHSAQGAPVPFIVFTHTTKQKNTGVSKLPSYIRRNGLGSVKKTDNVFNPNSGNYLTAYLWQVSAEGLRDWYQNYLRRRS